MKRYYIVAVIILHGFSALAQTSSKNYVMTETMLDSTVSTIVKSVQYFDGLGRPSILAAGGVNQQGNYLYTLQKYDWHGRESDRYLPGVGGATPDYLDGTSVQSLAQQSNNDSRAEVRPPTTLSTGPPSSPRQATPGKATEKPSDILPTKRIQSKDTTETNRNPCSWNIILPVL